MTVDLLRSLDRKPKNSRPLETRVGAHWPVDPSEASALIRQRLTRFARTLPDRRLKQTATGSGTYCYGERGAQDDRTASVRTSVWPQTDCVGEGIFNLRCKVLGVLYTVNGLLQVFVGIVMLHSAGYCSIR